MNSSNKIDNFSTAFDVFRLNSSKDFPRDLSVIWWFAHD